LGRSDVAYREEAAAAAVRASLGHLRSHQPSFSIGGAKPTIDTLVF